MVRLDGKLFQHVNDRYLGFNSNMVRLDVTEEELKAMPIMFQFQYGAIRCGNLIRVGVNKASFQFQYGAIRC